MKQTLGYPSRVAAIAALRGKDMTEREIAALIGIKPATVTSLEARARKRGSLGRGHAYAVRVSGEVLCDMQDAAADRQITPATLANTLLRTIARDGLFDAILDDLAASEEPKRAVGEG